MLFPDFIESVKQKANTVLCEKSTRLISMLPEIYRNYYLFTINFFPEPMCALKILASARKLPYEHYMRYVKFLSNQQEVTDLAHCN